MKKNCFNDGKTGLFLLMGLILFASIKMFSQFTLIPFLNIFLSIITIFVVWIILIFI